MKKDKEMFIIRENMFEGITKKDSDKTYKKMKKIMKKTLKSKVRILK